MKPSAVATALAARTAGVAGVVTYDHPDLIQPGVDVALVVGDPDVMLADGEAATFGAPFDRGVKMEWELQLRYTSADWAAGRDVLYDLLAALTAALETPAGSESEPLDAIVGDVGAAEPTEDADENPHGVRQNNFVNYLFVGGSRWQVSVLLNP